MEIPGRFLAKVSLSVRKNTDSDNMKKTKNERARIKMFKCSTIRKYRDYQNLTVKTSGNLMPAKCEAKCQTKP